MALDRKDIYDRRFTKGYVNNYAAINFFDLCIRAEK